MLVGSFVVSVLGNWHTILQTKAIWGLSWQQLGFFLYALSSCIVIGQLIQRVRQYENKKPNMCLRNSENVKVPLYFTDPVDNIRKVIGEPTFTRAIFANDPKSPKKGAVAEKVVAHIDFYDYSRKESLFSMVGRWAETPERAQVGVRVIETNQIDIAPNAMPRSLDVVLKYDDEVACYGLNNETPIRVLPGSGWRDIERKLDLGIYAVQIRLRGTNVDEVFWFELTNSGKGSKVELRPSL